MIGLIQRVTSASVRIDNDMVGTIDHGMVALIGVEKTDHSGTVARLLERILGYRIFADDEGKMNLSLRQTEGGLLLIPQFTLPADTAKGTRPSFSSCAPPQLGGELFDSFCTQAKDAHVNVACGRFQTDMQVTLTNDGPVTFWLQVNNPR
ncbi:MAG TPA: D-tyrosyl-tRNA(Tyr) deacylase [Chromatiaceae bacterium]|jgi:D-tyrosyl-tRNA(Tyr) deacylase|nr:D-tyrosyl-tRNA(Tyr) deacylase [Chromatiaceae bacterium]HIA07555.1 D-tyrosyl-tRNA(Tyr) deacylase [Chromatiaceae bacterium]HIB84402.1 D-tyrosyl-tRNA(Tyr) deacylase [Chromatiaceae bacterium]HIN81933.1 D-tyrosyl-tRNA(Tyr) deacylase [Chromatiales bacterium]HIO55384.1 D-tyrosyl-tRNA(Tyr) deacylase [Chromatiales bacterium]